MELGWNQGARLMRKILVAGIVAAALGLMGIANGSAAPASGGSLARAAEGGTLLSQIRYYRYHGRTCYTKCYRDFVIGPRVCRTYC
jgi:hypothetical protein